MAQVRRGDFLQPLRLVDGGAIDQHIKPAEAVLRGPEEVVDRLFVSQVGLERNRLDTATAQVFDRFGRFLGGGAIMDGNVITPSGQGIGDMPADTLFPAAGHQSHALY